LPYDRLPQLDLVAFGIDDPAELALSRYGRSRTTGPMLPLHVQFQNSTLREVIKRLRFPLEVMLVCARWYAASP